MSALAVSTCLSVACMKLKAAIIHHYRIRYHKVIAGTDHHILGKDEEPRSTYQQIGSFVYTHTEMIYSITWNLTGLQILKINKNTRKNPAANKFSFVTSKLRS